MTDLWNEIVRLAAEHPVAVVQNSGLPGRYRPLRSVKNDPDAIEALQKLDSDSFSTPIKPFIP